MKSTRVVPLFLLLLFPLFQQAQTRKTSPMIDALKTELTRTMDHLKGQPNPPYFLSYEVIETESAAVSGSFGALVSSAPPSRERQLGIDLRVGSYQLDNTHPIRGAMGNFFDAYSFYQMPIEDDPDALRAMLWYYTDQKYKRAVEQFISVKTNVKVKAEETDKSGDFSPAKAEIYDEADPPSFTVNRSQWEDKVRKYTAPFQRYGNIYSVDATISAKREVRWFSSSDGASIHVAETAPRGVRQSLRWDGTASLCELLFVNSWRIAK